MRRLNFKECSSLRQSHSLFILTIEFMHSVYIQIAKRDEMGFSVKTCLLGVIKIVLAMLVSGMCRQKQLLCM